MEATKAPVPRRSVTLCVLVIAVMVNLENERSREKAEPWPILSAMRKNINEDI